MIHEARVSDRKSVSEMDAGEWGLEIGEIVTVVGFVGSPGTLYAVVVSRGYYIACPYWLLDPLIPVAA